MELTNLIHRKINQEKLKQHPTSTGSTQFNKLADVISADRTFNWLFRLLRCSKSCWLRLTNYLWPRIKRGNFTDYEEKMIIHHQALLGNIWAAITSYLPQRIDIDIKNYWNTQLKKKLKRIKSDGGNSSQINHNDYEEDGDGFAEREVVSSSKGEWERRLQTDIHLANQALCEALSLDKTTIPSSSSSHHESNSPNNPTTSAATYASRAENISRLLKNWMKNPPKKTRSSETCHDSSFTNTAASSVAATASDGAFCATTTPDFDSQIFTFTNSSDSNSDASHSVETTTTNNCIEELESH